ncbi:DUF421 domain-containing protein [Evansella clarkii]|jgi:uncharacterized membrane protein YcaP (DUF421 family)|uniref:DUF421 domain-containing protein n=1 Tax=Evansella clarkii TaxID=79879 RepID=UPI0009970CBD|nr:DUF421 domain-containing protein [Evansella clarkii]
MLQFWAGSPELPVSGFIIRAVIVYVYIFLILKILGQRSIMSLNPIDFLFAVIIGDVLGETLSDGEIGLSGPFSSAGVVAAFHLSLSYLALKTPRFRRVIEDEPIILIKNGKILHEQLRKAKVTVESLMMDLRTNNAIDLNQVDYAVLESNGQISVLKKSKYDSLTPADMGQDPESKGYPSVIIQDGHIIDANLNKFADRAWLRKTLADNGFSRAADIFLLTVDETGKVYISDKKAGETG